MKRALTWFLEILLFLVFLFAWAWAYYPLFQVVGAIIQGLGVPSELARQMSAVLILAVPVSVFAIWMLRRVGRKKKDVENNQRNA